MQLDGCYIGDIGLGRLSEQNETQWLEVLGILISGQYNNTLDYDDDSDSKCLYNAY